MAVELVVPDAIQWYDLMLVMRDVLLIEDSEARKTVRLD